jgi:hypothetical protein
MAFRRPTLSNEKTENDEYYLYDTNDSFSDNLDWNVKFTFEGLGIFYKKSNKTRRVWLPQQGNHYLKLRIIRYEFTDGELSKTERLPINRSFPFTPPIHSKINIDFKNAEYSPKEDDPYYDQTILNINESFLHHNGTRLKRNSAIQREAIRLKMPEMQLTPKGTPYFYQIINETTGNEVKPSVQLWGEIKSTLKFTRGEININISGSNPIKLSIADNIKYVIDFNNLCQAADDICENEQHDFSYYYELIDLTKGESRFRLNPLHPFLKSLRRSKRPLCDIVRSSNLNYEDF